MTAGSTSRARAWRVSPAVAFAAVGAVVTAAVGMVASRPDVIAVGLPLALWVVIALTVPAPSEPTASIVARPDEQQGWLSDEIRVRSDAELIEMLITQSERTRTRVLLPGTAGITAATRALHSGPVRAVQIAARTLAADAGMLGVRLAPTGITRTVHPVRTPLSALPLAPRLTGLHGSHEGARPGSGGDFRDVHPFAPGDELRRVDWRATARAARRPGELFVRRTNALSDASVVIVMDTVDDLGAVVATWGTDDRERCGVTSLDQGRAAARSLAEATIADGDRVSFHTLAHDGRSVRGGTGPRHLARLVAEISACGRAGDDSRYRRTPVVPHGSLIYVLSTFFDGAAAELAVRWRASGHRVIAVDILPELDRTRLAAEKALALRVLLAERQDMFRELAAASIDTVRWDAHAASHLAVSARSTPAQRAGGVRR